MSKQVKSLIKYYGSSYYMQSLTNKKADNKLEEKYYFEYLSLKNKVINSYN